MQTVTVDIINSKALRLLHDMELLELIRVHKQNSQSKSPINWCSKYKGAMTKQPITDINIQLNELRNAWE